MKNISVVKEGFIIALFFLGAFVALCVGPPGVLTWPGLVVALAGILLSITGYFSFTTAIGIIASSGSFVGQSITGICYTCLWAAICFALAGIISGIFLSKERPTIAIILMIILVGAVSIFGVRTGSKDIRPFQYQTEVYAAELSNEIQNQQVDNKVQVFLSVDCPGCKRTMNWLIENDPKGQYWLPVIIPHYQLARGEKVLQEIGYTGIVVSAAMSPSGGVPCFKLLDGTIITGRQAGIKSIQQYFDDVKGDEGAIAR